MTVAGVRGLGHPDADPADRDRPGDEFQRDGSTLAFGDVAERKRLPRAFGRAVIEGLELASPELYRVAFGVMVRPCDADRIDVNLAAQVNNDPLRMQRVVFAGESLGQVRIALPVGLGISIGEPRPSIAVAAAETAMGQGRRPRAVNHFGGVVGVADEVAFLFVGIAPLPCRIPVPGLDHKLGVLAISHGLPSRAKDFFQQRVLEQMVGSTGAQAVNRRAQRANGAERVHHVRRIGIDDDSLRARRRDRQQHSADHKGNRESALDTQCHDASLIAGSVMLSSNGRRSLNRFKNGKSQPTAYTELFFYWLKSRWALAPLTAI